MSPEVPLFDALFEHPHDYILLIRDETILRVNRSLAALLGRSQEALKGSAILPFVVPQDLPLAQAIHRIGGTEQAGGEPIVRLVAADGSWRSIRWTVRCVTYAGGPAILVIGADLTNRLQFAATPRERAAARKTLAQAHTGRFTEELKPEGASPAPASRDLEALDGLKTDLISTISHELRTPLVSIRGYADLLSGGHLGSLTGSQQQAVEVMLRNVDRLMQIIENILTYSALENGQVALQLQRVNLNTALASIVRLSQASAEQRQVLVDLDCSEDRLTIEADPYYLATLFHQLISNAIKFNQLGGLVTVGARRLRGGAEISVVDTGVGIPAEQLNRIFDRFYQVDGSRTRRYSGVGLGLALVHGIVMLHGGTISVQSQPEEGSRFVVWLPERPAALTAQTAE
ncbi:MAG: PAS domain-containing sensor histidine kinase [Ardenticatenaceae bacterium]|nr:PAS domain-containing sensor histidine kinase [Ardenticatenaceae bacterium]